MTWTRKDFEAVADVVVAEYPVGESFDYETAAPWERGAYDLWNTTRLALAELCNDRGGLNVNGNRRFDRDRFMARTDCPKRDRIARMLKDGGQA